MKDYTQSGEQAIILKYFEWDGVVRPRTDSRNAFTVLDIGANDGLTFSNSRALVELGWNAVLVEPAPEPFKKLNLLYAPDPAIPSVFFGVQLVNAAITTQDGPLTFYSSGTHLKKGDTDLLSTTHPEELARWKKSGEQFTKTVVRGITFATLVKETGLTRADFISIDAEGADYDILKQIDLTAVGCRLLCVEVNQRGDAEFTEYAKRHGMRLMWKNYENRIYAR